MAELIRPAHSRPTGCYDRSDPHIVTPVIIPWGCHGGCCDDCDCEGIPRHHIKTHARDTIIVHPGTARTTIKLDDGSGEGYCYAAPLHCLELRFRFKGERCFCFETKCVMAEWGGELTVMWPREWEHLRDGYYEAEIVMNPHSPVERRGGWLLFYKAPIAQLRPVSATNTPARPREDTHIPYCAPATDMVGERLSDVADCGSEGCSECP